MAWNSNTYAICNISDIDNIDFNTINTTSLDTVRLSVDETLFLIEWKNSTPNFITSGLVIPEQILNHQDTWGLMHTSDWISQM
tara:strand:+ start:314 stop:562 length:249 start_codon:yes stop_codon:yes gene_type:complete